MTLYDSPELVASRLQSEISRSESRSYTQISEVERRLNSRIHEIEMAAIRRLETACLCLIVGTLAFVLGLAVDHGSCRGTADEVQPAAQASQPKAQLSDGPSPRQDKAQ